MPVLQVGSMRILYIHVPKTGGSYVEDLLRSYGTVSGVRFGRDFSGLPCSPQHFHAPLIEHMYSVDRWEIQHDFDYVFMTVRDPVKRLKSEFRYRAAGSRWTRVRSRLNVPVSFDRWVRRTLQDYRRHPFHLDNHIRPQHEFRTFEAEVFRMEDGLHRIVEALDRVTGRSGELPAREVNASVDRTNFDYTLSSSAQAMVADHTAEDCDVFGYTFAP